MIAKIAEKFYDCVDCHFMLSTRTTWLVKGWINVLDKDDVYF